MGQRYQINRSHLTPAHYVEVKEKRVRLNVRGVACPDCKAPVGEYCVSQKGTKIMVVHASRQRLAARRRNEELANKKEEPPKEYDYPTAVCPACDKTVRVVLAQFDNTDHGIVRRETFVFGAHQASKDVKRTSTSIPCQLAYLPVDTSKITPPKENNT